MIREGQLVDVCIFVLDNDFTSSVFTIRYPSKKNSTAPTGAVWYDNTFESFMYAVVPRYYTWQLDEFIFYPMEEEPIVFPHTFLL